MGFLGSLFGGSSGSGFQAQNAPITAATNTDQLNTSWLQSEDALKAQRDFVNSLGANGAQGLGAQAQNLRQLQQQAAGQGPNPALAQLNQATGQNVANQAALMAGQRGAGANVGLLARQAAQQGAATQQQAAGQGATLQAQQQLAAQQALGQQANQLVGQQQQGISGLNQASQSEQGNILGALQGQNNAVVSSVGNQNNANAGIAAANTQAQGSLFGGLLGGAASGLTMAALAKGGMIQKFADGGSVDEPQSFAGKFLQQWSGRNGAAAGGTPASSPMAQMGGSGALGQGSSQFGQAIGKGLAGALRSGPQAAPIVGTAGNAYGAVGNLSSPEAIDPSNITAGPVNNNMFSPQAIDPTNITAPAFSQGGMPMVQGGDVPGAAQVKGDNPKNDTVPAVLSPGEIVIPRHILSGRDPITAAANFVKQELAKNGKPQTEQTQKFDDGGTADEQLAPSQVDRSPASDFGATSMFIPPASSIPSLSDISNGINRAGAAAMGLNQTPPASQTPPPDQITSQVMGSAIPGRGGSGEVGKFGDGSDPYGFMAGNKAYMGGLGQQMKGIKGEAAAEDLAARAQTDVLAQTQDQMAQIQAKGEVDRQKNLDELHGLMSDYQNQTIDPNRLMSNMGTGSKIATAIGLALGGMGAGLTHGQNPALAYLQQAIDNDIKGQQADLGKKDNLISMNMKQGQSLQQATENARNQLMALTSVQMKQAGLKYAGSAAQARADQMSGALYQQASSNIGNNAMRSAWVDAAKSGQGSPSLPAFLDPAADRRVEVNGSVFHAPDNDTAKKVRPQLEALDNLDTVVNKIDNFNKNVGTTYKGTTNNGRAKGLNREKDLAMAQIAAAGGQVGRLIDKFDDTNPDAGAFLQNEQSGKSRSAHDFIAAQRASLLRNYLSNGPALGK